MSDPSLSTQERVIKAISNVITTGDIQVDSTLEELEVDSLAAIEILFEVEEEFDLNISGDSSKMQRIKSVRDVIEGVERLLAGEGTNFWGEDPSETPNASDSAQPADAPDKSPDADPDGTPGETRSS